jgi:hypothetical protein
VGRRFLSNIFPFEERSGLNVSNRFNVHTPPIMQPESVIANEIDEAKWLQFVSVP